MKFGRIKRKRNHSDCNIPFPIPSSCTLLFSHVLPSSQLFPSTDSGNMCTYVKMYASIFANILIYVRASNTTYTNTETFKITQYTQKIEQKTNVQYSNTTYDINERTKHFFIIVWCNGYRHRKWTRWHEFKSWTRLIAFHIAIIPLGKVWLQLFSLQLWVNSRAE